jgi:hypothetical protein
MRPGEAIIAQTVTMGMYSPKLIESMGARLNLIPAYKPNGVKDEMGRRDIILNFLKYFF